MEIPYIVTPRKDTGLFNSKIAIWLFLASEVMLFGGFFSAYVFLRIGADYPWPERTLPVLPGLINTFVLIGSSVTVVFAWAALKMRQWRKFQIFMGITIACAAIFMVLKGLEYSVKLHHQAVRLSDYTILEGHLGYEKEGDQEVLNHKGQKIEENMIFVETSKLSFNNVTFYKPWVEELISQAEHKKATITLAEDIKAVVKQGAPEEIVAKAGEPLTVDLLNKLKKVYLAARKNNSGYRTAALREEWAKAKTAEPEKKSWELASGVNVDAAALAPKLLTEIGGATFNVTPPVKFDFKPRDIREGATQSTLRDGTVVTGNMAESPMAFHYVDAIDFQYLAMKAVQKGIDPEVAIENSWLIKNNAFARDAWQWHRGEIAKLEKKLIEDYKYDKNGKPNREPTAKERYRIGWQDLAKWNEALTGKKLTPATALVEEFKGPNYEERGNETFPELSVPREQIAFAAKFTPAWNTYYAIYYTITGLHGLHVIGGALVLGYYLFFGRKMYLANPEWLANRVEVGGLFWHFVDLVWIFVFPVLYLM